VPNAVTVDLANAVLAKLNAASWSQAFTATLAWVPEFDKKDLSTLRVTVTPLGYTQVRATRAKVEEDHQVGIAVQKSISSESDVAALVYLLQELGDWFIWNAPPTYTTAKPVTGEYIPADRDRLKVDRVFLGTITLNYKVIR
jgi:hypothetical protein